jgi:hypothetical protein
MDLHGDALADAVLVHARAQRRHGAHVFMTRRKHLVERFAAADHRRRAVVDDLEVSRADRHGIDVHQHLGASRHRDRLVHQTELAGIAQHPGPHVLGQRIRGVGLTLAGWLTRVASLRVVSARRSTRSRRPGCGQTGLGVAPDNKSDAGTS